MSSRTLIVADHLWDGLSPTVRAPAAVLLDEGRIVAIGSPGEFGRSQWEVVALPKVTLLPGLMDMHVHLSDDGWLPAKLLSSGITTVRDTGNNHHTVLALRARQQEGAWEGPRIVCFGPLLDNDPPFWAHLAVPLGADTDIEQVVDVLAAHGVDGYKTYVGTTFEQIRRVVTRAHERGKRATCHNGATPVSQALSVGMDCVEHTITLAADVINPDGRGWASLEIASPRVESLICTFLRAGAWFCPTQAIMLALQYGYGAQYRAMPGYAEYPAAMRDFFSPQMLNVEDSATWTPDRTADAAEGFQNMQALVHAIYAAGVPMLAGSDAPCVPPGAGFHLELELLVEAGIPVMDVLAMATRRGGEFLGQPELGVLRPGGIADLIAVHGNPCADIRAVRDIAAVWQGGRRLDIARLRQQAAMAAAASPAKTSSGCPPFGIPFSATKGNLED